MRWSYGRFCGSPFLFISKLTTPKCIPDSLPPPFTRVEVETSEASDSPDTTSTSTSISAFRVSMLGKSVTVGADGMINEILVNSDPQQPNRTTAALAAPVRFEVSVGGVIAPLVVKAGAEAKPNADDYGRSVSWNSVASDLNSKISLNVSATLDYSGYVDYSVTLEAKVEKADRLSVSVEVPMAPEAAVFSLGLGRKGGLLASWFSEAAGKEQIWKWDGVNGNNALWLGSSGAGVRLFPKVSQSEVTQLYGVAGSRSLKRASLN